MRLYQRRTNFIFKIIIVILLSCGSVALSIYLYIDLNDDVELKTQIQESKHLLHEEHNENINKIKSQILFAETELKRAQDELNQAKNTVSDKDKPNIVEIDNYKMDSIQVVLFNLHKKLTEVESQQSYY
jgi:hypothetical protein